MTPEFKNRTHKTKGGGVAILGNAHTTHVRRIDLEENDLEAIFMETAIKCRKTIIASLYPT